MSKALVIAEKPSVASDIAEALGGFKRKDDYYENDDYVITFAIGHLLEIEEPNSKPAKSKNGKDAKSRKPGKWSLASLPVMPDRFDLKPTKDRKAVIDRIKKLESRDDVGDMINACDAGREGELIFHYIVSYLGIEKPVMRLWLQSMTSSAIKKGFTELRAADDFAALRDAAVARAQADWLVGINATRAFTALNSKDGGFALTTAGRVQTPTLSLLVERERERRAHVPKQYWTLAATLKVEHGSYEAKWVRGEGDSEEAGEETGKKTPRDRIFDGTEAKRIEALLRADAAAGEATDDSNDRFPKPPGLYDLNALQRDANSVHSLPAKATLAAAQSLYEKHKLLTYPRTESRHLPEDYKDVCARTLGQLDKGGVPYLAAAVKSATEGVGKVGNKVFDDKKISDHFAIIPTGLAPKKELSEVDRKVFDLVCRRFVAAFMPSAQVLETVRTTVISGESFETRGRIVVKKGWLEVANKLGKDRELPALAGESETAVVEEVVKEEKVTKPPARYDDAALLGAMQGAYRFIKDEEVLAAALKEGGGLGTPATRASTIEELVRKEYVTRIGRELVSTTPADSLYNLCKSLKIDELTNPKLTGEWESKLKLIEQGEGDPEEFLSEIRELVTRIVEKVKAFDPDEVEGDYATLKEQCPRVGCGGTMKEGPRKYACDKCGYFFWKVVASRNLTPEESDVLIKEGRIGPFDDFKSKSGNDFSATLLLDRDKGKVSFEFPNATVDDFDPSQIGTLESIGTCPKEGCDGKVLVAPSNYTCEKLLDGSGTCDFKLGRVICKRELAPEEVSVMLGEAKKSDLLSDFISKRGRPFKAYLNLTGAGRLRFEFEPRAAKKSTKKSSAKPEASSRAA